VTKFVMLKYCSFVG